MPHPARAKSLNAMRWLQRASVTNGKALHLALLLLARCSESGKPCLLLTRRMLAAGHVSRDAAYGALMRLQELGMVNMRRLPGRSPQVILLEPGTDAYLCSTGEDATARSARRGEARRPHCSQQTYVFTHTGPPPRRSPLNPARRSCRAATTSTISMRGWRRYGLTCRWPNLSTR
ncbi:hypothetical protein ACPOLB_25890 [Rubrivivax sp. RP6-9]|uniref:hypothetical protein n=1 Tax=Rubrivivax sp. RP6-9 TaxID=3415750 RepID=UPI003CC57FDC